MKINNNNLKIISTIMKLLMHTIHSFNHSFNYLCIKYTNYSIQFSSVSGEGAPLYSVGLNDSGVCGKRECGIEGERWDWR